MCGKQLGRERLIYSELNLNQDKATSRRQYRWYGKARQRCTGLNLIHYTAVEWPGTICVSYILYAKKGYLKNGLSCFQVAF